MDQIEFTEDMSSASCLLSEIKNFIYGGQSSRFWMLRKHINSTPRKHIEKVPFKSWNCITLQLAHRDVDLVIKDDRMMKMFIKYLVNVMQTHNGIRGSATKLIHSMTQNDILDFKAE